MTDALESALLIELVKSIKWSAALPTTGSTGTLTTVDPGAPFDVLQYAHRDRELQHRDMIIAAAVAKIAVETSTVWNAPTVRPILQGVEEVTDSTGTNIVLPFNHEDSNAPVVNSQVFHVKNSSIPYDAFRLPDKDLYNRDLLLFETLARACEEIFDKPGITRIDTSGTNIVNTSVWSKAEGINTEKIPNAAEPLNVNLFKRPDQYLAERDNQLAAYVSRLIQALRNPFEFTTRLYVAIDGTDSREKEVYSLAQNYFVVGTFYSVGNEVLYNDQWYRAVNNTTDTPPSANWLAISAPTLRVFIADPALDARNRIIYDTNAKTLQWFRETNDLVHIPQIYALVIPGILPGQTIRTIPAIPEDDDVQFYRQKAARIVFSGANTTDLTTLSPTAGENTTGGIDQLFDGLKQVSLPVPGVLTIQFPGVTCLPGKYRMSLLVRPQPVMTIPGSQNTLGSAGTLDGYTFTSTGSKVNYLLPLPNGAWQMFLHYTNISGVTTEFGVQGDLNGLPVLQDTVPLPYRDDNGDPLPNGQLVTSQEIDLQPDGSLKTLGLRWTYGDGQFHIRELEFVNTEQQTSRYTMAGTLAEAVSRLDVVGQRLIPEVMPFDFTINGSLHGPSISLEWSSGTGFPQLPLLIEQIQLQQVGTYTPTPFTTGFESFRQDMVERAGRSALDQYNLAVRMNGTNALEFRDNTDEWSRASTEQWMSFLEVYEPRLRQQDEVTYISANRQYKVIGGTNVTYNGTAYTPDQTFYGVTSTGTYNAVGGATVQQIGAFILSAPGHIGKPALVPAGLEFVLATGTVRGNYDAPSSQPTIQALQPWMIERGMYVTQPDFWSPETL